MKTLAAALMLGMAFAAGGVAAQDMKKDSMAKDPMMKPMTMQECKDHMAMSKSAAKKDDAMMKKDTMCADMMKKDSSMMKDSGTSGQPKK